MPGTVKVAKLVRDGSEQIVRIPQEFTLPGSDVTITQEGPRLVLELVRTDTEKPRNWKEFLEGLEPLDEEFPNVDEGLLPLDDIKL